MVDQGDSVLDLCWAYVKMVSTTCSATINKNTNDDHAILLSPEKSVFNFEYTVIFLRNQWW